MFKSGIAYGDDLDHVKAVALDETKQVKSLLATETIEFYFTDIGNSSYNFMLLFWIKFDSDKDFCNAMSDIIMQIKKRFKKENISISYPVTTLDFGVKGGLICLIKSSKLTQKCSILS